MEHTTNLAHVAPAGEFVYMPARAGQLSPNRIQNTAMTGIVLKTDISEAVRSTVAHELKLAGLSLANHRKVLGGQIETLSVDDVRTPAVWTLTIHYVVHDAATQRVVYTASKTVKHRCAKFTNARIALDDTVKQSVDALLRDPAFIESLG